MKPYQVSVGLAFMMACASIAGTAIRPSSSRPTATAQRYELGSMIPATFGTWQELPTATAAVVNPQTQELLDKLYSQVLTRTYMNRDGYRIMLSIAYGNDQRGSLAAHKPEVCYPAQGFKLHTANDAEIKTPYGRIDARRLTTSLGPRHEPVTYWFTMGGTAVRTKLEQRLVEIRSTLTGRIPDGLLFRVSSIDEKTERAYERQADFVLDLLHALPPEDRARLAGLGPLDEAPDTSSQAIPARRTPASAAVSAQRVLRRRHDAATGLPASYRSVNLDFPSLLATARNIYPYSRLGTFKNRARFMMACLRHRDALCDLLTRQEHQALRKELLEHPDTLGFVEWPYINAAWPVMRRFQALSEHQQAVNSDMSAFDMPRSGALLVADLSSVSEGLKLTVDRAYWLMREGGLVFNQFVGDERLMTMAFSFGLRDGKRVAYVGGVQGSNTEVARAAHQTLRRDLHRMRSRDFVVKAFQSFMHALGVSEIYCVSDRYRHHRHIYFTRDPDEKYHTDYDEVWREHLGTPTDDGFFRLATPAARRPLEAVPAKDRGLYRRRYAMLDDLAADMQERFAKVT